MEYKDFEDYIINIQDFDKYMSSVDDLGISLYETPIPTLFFKMQHRYEDLVFTQEALDVIDWWLYEKFTPWDGKEKLEMYDKDGNIIPTDSIEDLWNYVKDYLK